MPQELATDETSLKVPIDQSYWVVPGKLLAGAYPGAEDAQEAATKIKALAECGIRQSISLMESDEVNYRGRSFRPYQDEFMARAKQLGSAADCRRLPIKDLSIPSRALMKTILDLIDRSIAEDRPVFVHCLGGIGRTGTVVGCYLLRHQLADRINVLDKIAFLRRNVVNAHLASPETPAQRDMVRGWHEPVADSD
jgi:hypothetical protein